MAQAGEWFGEPTYRRAEIQDQIRAALARRVVDWTAWQPEGAYVADDLKGFPTG